MPVASINMSLGGGKSTTNCDTDSRKPIIDNLRSVGIATGDRLRQRRVLATA